MKTIGFSLLVAIQLCATALASPPVGYYLSAEGQTGAALESVLHDIIDGHTVISYSKTDEVMGVIDEDPNNTNNVGLIYSTFSMAKTGIGSSGSAVWNREHLWPRSYGLSTSGADNSDLHNLYPCNASVNSSRGNKYFDESDSTGSSNSISPENTYDSDSWEPSDEDKGKIARAAFYMAVRYDGSDANTLDVSISDSPNAAEQRMGKLTTLLAWNREFPPTLAEKARSNAIYTGVQTTDGFRGQGNRNPFVDYPQLADAIFLGSNVETLGKWQVRSFPIGELDDLTLTGPLADPDGDSIPNILEFLGNSLPDSDTSKPLATVTFNGGTALLRYRRAKGLELSGYDANWETSSDLKIWDPVLTTTITEADEGLTTVETLSIPQVVGKEFFRLRVFKIEND